MCRKVTTYNYLLSLAHRPPGEQTILFIAACFVSILPFLYFAFLSKVFIVILSSRNTKISRVPEVPSGVLLASARMCRLFCFDRVLVLVSSQRLLRKDGRESVLILPFWNRKLLFLFLSSPLSFWNACVTCRSPRLISYASHVFGSLSHDLFIWLLMTEPTYMLGMVVCTCHPRSGVGIGQANPHALLAS